MRRCDDRPPLLEEPFAQTLSGKNKVHCRHWPVGLFNYSSTTCKIPHKTGKQEENGPMAQRVERHKLEDHLRL